MKFPQPFTIFVVEEDTLVVLALLEMDLKMPQPISQRRLWVEKSKVTNHQRSKKIWVPKAS